MCDTFVVMPKSSLNRKVWFAKNSDRSPNEPNLIIQNPETTHDLAAEPDLRLTYISVPQVEKTYGVLMVKPSWTWGCEIGVNRQGLMVGNEAVYTRGGYGDEALIGMDICRLVLERCDSAFAAVQMIGALLEQYGQGGNCGFDSEHFYDNAYLVADTSGAYVVETAARFWVAKKVDDLYAISNILSVEDGWDYGCDALKDQNGRMNFAKKYTDDPRTSLSGAQFRRFSVYRSLLNDRDGKPSFTRSLLSLKKSAKEVPPGIDYASCRRALREHMPGGKRAESPCMHFGDKAGSGTTGSLVCCFEEGLIALTGGSTPCRAVFKPFSLKGDIPFGNDPVSAERYWLRREVIQRNLLAGVLSEEDYVKRSRALEAEMDGLQAAATFADAAGVNRKIYEMEDALVAELLQNCELDPARLTPVLNDTGYRNRWNQKNEALFARVRELGL